LIDLDVFELHSVFLVSDNLERTEDSGEVLEGGELGFLLLDKLLLLKTLLLFLGKVLDFLLQLL
jgi:hypothetical protein